MAVFVYPVEQVTITGSATEATLLQVESNTASTVTELQGVNTELNSQTTELQSVNTELDTQTVELQSINAELDLQTPELQAMAAELILQTAELNDVNAELDTQTAILSEIEAAQTRTVVDQIDSTPLLDTSSTNIPASSSDPVEVVASLASNVSKIQTVEDIGSFIGLYTGAALSEDLLAVLPLGGGEIEVQIPAGTRVSLRAMENAAINSGKIAINFLG